MARAGWKAVGAAAPEAPFALVGVGARATGLPIGPPDRSGAELETLAAAIAAATEELYARLGTAGAGGPGAAVSVADVVGGMGATLRIMAAHGFRLPKDLVLYVKNLLYLNGFADAVAPDGDLLGHIDPVLTWFQARHGLALAQMLAPD